MKKILIMVTAAILLGMAACAQNKSKTENMEKKTLVAYFSATGTTKQVAEKIAAVTHADIMPIEPQQPYTEADLDWNDRNSRSSVEMNDPKSHPAVKKTAKNLSDYDVVFIGYPIWWDLAPTVVNTFIEENNLSGKTVVPFATSGGSSITNSTLQLKKQYPDINWKEGKLLNGASEKEIAAWVKESE